jgi:hypothetical protein
MHFPSIIAGILAAATVSAHPGHDPAVELAEREAALTQFSRRDLAHCADKIRERGLEARSIARRNALVTKLQKRANLESTFLCQPNIPRCGRLGHSIDGVEQLETSPAC